MRGKIVNLCMGFMNLLFGALIIVFTMCVPQDKTVMTVQENFVVGYIVKGIYLMMVAIACIDAFQSYNLRTDTTFNTGYIIGIFSLSFIFIKQPAIAAFSIISGIIILFKSIKENLVEIDSTTAISVSIVIMAGTAILGLLSFTYASIGESIRNKENKNELSYKSDYFKYITELDIEDPYINVEKDGKFGYINPRGEVVINFEYDYASPFVEITEYDKKFYIALVCKDGSSTIILKNKREVMSYRTESSDEDFDAKLEELENIYKNVLNQQGEMKYEIQNITENKNKVPAYSEISSEYTYRYDYNEEYDLTVTKSSLGLADEYQLVKKADSNIKIKLDATKLDYDENYLYLFSNGTIPFYELSKRTQGWFTSYGSKNAMTGKAQILDFFGDRILLRNYNNNTVYFIDSSGNMLSEEYKNIYVCGEGRYIVKNNDESFKIIDDGYNNVFNREFATINPRLVTQNLYITLDTTENIKTNEYGYAEMNWSLLNFDGQVLLDGIEQIYDVYFKIPESGKKDENYKNFENELKSLRYEFVGDKFYLEN